jgi:HNH endonuclease
VPAVVSGVCEFCTKSFTRPRGGGKDKARFCDRICSSKFMSASRRSPDLLCEHCGLPKPKNASSLHISCRKLLSVAAVSAVTLGELRSQYSVSQYHGKIRGLSRSVFCGTLECVVCGYNLHVDIAHIKPVADFPMSATLGEVNSPDNLTALCPNHHWEFDNGYLELPNMES